MPTAGYTWTDNTTNTEIAKGLNVTLVLGKLQEYRKKCVAKYEENASLVVLPRVIK
jgi:hypothetical protein